MMASWLDVCFRQLKQEHDQGQTGPFDYNVPWAVVGLSELAIEVDAMWLPSAYVILGQWDWSPQPRVEIIELAMHFPHAAPMVAKAERNQIQALAVEDDAVHRVQSDATHSCNRR